MRVVYVAGPLIAADHYAIRLNIDRAAAVGIEIARHGVSPVIPHTNTGAWFIGTCTHEFWYAATLELLRRCDAVITVPGWEASVGAKGEVDEAKRLGLPVFHSIPDLRAWLALFEKLTASDDSAVTTIASSSALAKVRAKLGPNALIGRNEQFPEAPFHVGVHEHGEWKFFGAGLTWEDALKNVKKVKFQKADRSFVYEEE